MKAALVALIVLRALSSSAAAETFHVAPGGDDANPGTAAKPWATLQHAADRVVAGDRVVAHAGEYRGFALRRRGKAGAPIELAGEGATIVGDNPNTPDAIAIAGAAYVTVSGFAIRGASRAGVRVEQSTQIALRGLRVDGAGVTGIAVLASDDVEIAESSVIATQRATGIQVSGGARPRITGTQVGGGAKDGIVIEGALRDGGSGVVEGAWLEGDRVWGNAGAGIVLDGAPHAMVASTVAWGNAGGGVIAKRESGSQPSVGVRLVNDTIVAPDGAWAVRLRDGSTDAVVANDILLSADPKLGALDVAVTCLPFASDHNAVTPRFTLDGTTVIDLVGWRVQTKHDADSFAADSTLFTAAASNDFTLAAGSPAIDRGAVVRGIERDAAGHRRVVGARVDLGAYEACSGAACERAAAPPSPAVLGPRGGCCDGGGGGASAALGTLLALSAARGRRGARARRDA